MVSSETHIPGIVLTWLHTLVNDPQHSIISLWAISGHGTHHCLLLQAVVVLVVSHEMHLVSPQLHLL